MGNRSKKQDLPMADLDLTGIISAEDINEGEPTSTQREIEESVPQRKLIDAEIGRVRNVRQEFLEVELNNELPRAEQEKINNVLVNLRAVINQGEILSEHRSNLDDRTINDWEKYGQLEQEAIDSINDYFEEIAGPIDDEFKFRTIAFNGYQGMDTDEPFGNTTP